MITLKIIQRTFHTTPTLIKDVSVNHGGIYICMPQQLMKTIPSFHSTSVFRTPKFDPVKFVLNGPYVIYMDVVYVGFAGAKTDDVQEQINDPTASSGILACCRFEFIRTAPAQCE